MPETGGERTERATPKKKEDARKKGNVAKSTEVNTAVVILTGTVVLALSGAQMVTNIAMIMKGIFENLSGFELSPATLPDYGKWGFVQLIKIVGPVAISVLVVGVTANVLQVGFMLSGEMLKPDLKKISPVAGFKKIISVRSLAELVKGVIKLAIVGLVIFVTIKGASSEFIPLMDQSIYEVLGFLGLTMLKISLRACVAIVFMAALDYAFQKWDYERNLRMTKQEIRDEYKEHEGDPLIKSRIKSLQRDVARRRMIAEVPNADVVITNPIHYAVALKYDAEVMNAPVVLAKGSRKIAERIKKIAGDHSIPVIENPELARALYKLSDIGMPVPVELYQGVAEILAYVYNLRNKAN